MSSLPLSRLWHHTPAPTLPLGRLASKIAILLMGKHKPIYQQATDVGDYVVVTDSNATVVTGKKNKQKVYRTHSSYPGGLKTVPFETKLERDSAEIIRHAVSGMLPKNRLRKVRLGRLHIFPEKEHPYEQNIIKRYDEDWSKSKVEARDLIDKAKRMQAVQYVGTL